MREAYMREGTDHVDDYMLRDLARKCARCPHNYPYDNVCAGCDYNVASYNGGDVQRAKLMRISCAPIPNAERNYQAYRDELDRSSRAGTIFWVVFALIALGALAFIYVDAQKPIYREGVPVAQPVAAAPKQAPVAQPVAAAPKQAPVAAAPKQAAAPATPTRRNNTQICLDIRNTLTKVHAQIRDINNDGVINCQDYAILFHKLYPYASDIMFNRHLGSTGHVYIRVESEGGTYSIEPQHNGPDWLMAENWSQWQQVRRDSVEVTYQYGAY